MTRELLSLAYVYRARGLAETLTRTAKRRPMWNHTRSCLFTSEQMQRLSTCGAARAGRASLSTSLDCRGRDLAPVVSRCSILALRGAARGNLGRQRGLEQRAGRF